MPEEEKAEQSQIEHLTTQLADAIKSSDGSAWFYTGKAFRLKLAGIILGGTTTVLIGLDQKGIFRPYGDYISSVALVTSAAVAGLTTWEAFFSYRDRWSSFTEAAQKLRRVADELAYANKKSSGISQSQLDEFFKRYQKILQDVHAGWLGKKADARQ